MMFQAIKKLFFLLSIVLFNHLCQSQTIATFNSAGTWVCPAGINAIQVECWGAGGGGGGSTSSSSKYVGGGGAGGSYVKNLSVPVTPGVSYTITIGAGGAGGSTSSTTCNGSNGGNSSFSGTGITSIVATGGGAGLGGQSSLTAGTGAAASTTSNAGFSLSYSYAGGSGTTATWVSSTSAKSGPGGGAAGNDGTGSTTAIGSTSGGSAGAGGGIGGAGLTTSGAGNIGLAPGGGGGGGFGSSGAGGKGGDGKVIISYLASTSPTLFVSTNTIPLDTFNTTTLNTSTPQSFTVSGINLTAYVTLNAPTHFEISTTDTSGYSSSIVLSPTSGNLNNTIIYVRLKSNLSIGSFNENIVAGSTGATSQNSICIGNVSAPPTPTINNPSVSLLSLFNYGVGYGPSAEQSFTISAINLTDSIRLSTSNNNYEISLNADTGFLSGTNVLNLEPTEGAITTTLYARLKRGLNVGSYSSLITLTATGAQSKSLSCTGSVTAVSVFTTQPHDTSVCSGSNTQFSVSISTTSTIKWQRSTDGTNWVDITSTLDAGTTYSGFSTSTLILTGTTSLLNYYQYRAVTSDAISFSAYLFVSPSSASIGTVSGSSTICTGSTTKFTCSAGGTSVVDNINPDDFLVPKFSSVTITSNVAYGAPNGSFHLVDVYQPTGDTATKRPAVMFLHGGGFRTGNDKSQSYVVSFCTYLAKCGYVAFAPNYNVGGGHTFAQNLLAVQDADLCMNWIRANGQAYGYDANYLFEGGGSAGGHLSCNWMLNDGDAKYNGFVSNLNNIIAFANCWGSSPDADRLYNYSNINSNTLPVFSVHGTSDATVSISISDTLNKYIANAGVYYSYWRIPGETHGCPNHIAAISDTMAHFFNRVWKRKGNAMTNSGNATGGSWSSNNTNIATVNATTGVVTGISQGTAIITYTIPNCSDAISASKTITITSGTSTTQTANACASYLWNGSTYTSSGAYTWHGTSIGGCDSAVVLNLTIKQKSYSNQNITSCSTYSWNGANYTTSGTYSWTGTNSVGCDSVATLQLTINTSPSASIVNGNSFVCSGSDAVFYVTGTTDATLSYNFNGGTNKTIQLKNGVAAIVNPNTTSAVTLNLISIINSNGTCTSTLNTNAIINVGNSTATVYWNCTTASPSNPISSSITVSNVTQGNNNGTTTMLSSSSASSGYTGASGGNNITAAARTGVLNTTTSGSAYFQFAVNAANATNFQLTGISFGSRSASTGPLAFCLRNSLDNYASNITSDTLTNNSTWSLKSKSNLNVSALTDTFRIYGYNGTGSAASGTSNWRLDDINLTFAIPNPAPTVSSVSSNQTICNTLINNALIANTPSVGIGTWSQISGPGNTTFGNVHESNTRSTVTLYGTYVYRWTIINGCTNASTSDISVVYKNNTRIETITTCDAYTWHGITYTNSTNTPVFVQSNPSGCDSLISLNLTLNNCSSVINLKLFLEGAYIGNGSMRATIYDLGLSNISNETDSIQVELWSTNNLSSNTPDYSKKIVLYTNGNASLSFPGSFVGKNYYVVIKNRNIVETWSRNALLLASSNSYDFTTSQTKAFSDGFNLPMKTMGDGKCAIYSGDANQDGGIDISDMQVTQNDASNFLFGYYPSDCNGDLGTDISDLQLIENHVSFFIFCARPY